MPGPRGRLLDFWGIHDNGLDNLGQRPHRTSRPKQSTATGSSGSTASCSPYDFQLTRRVRLDQRPQLPAKNTTSSEWDELKDETTGLELKRLGENSSWSISADVRVNDFFTQTDWLPRADHFWLGQPLFDDTFTWYEHSSVGYAQFGRRRADNAAVGNPAPTSRSTILPWEQFDAQGERFATRQEIDWPFQLGAVKVVPYALGEVGPLGRRTSTASRWTGCYGQAGVRASLPMWSVDPTVESDLFNVHGIAHKVVFDVEFLVRRRQPGHDQTCRSTIRWTTTRSRPSGGGWSPTRSACPSMICRRPCAGDSLSAVRRAVLRPADRPGTVGSPRRARKSPTT